MALTARTHWLGVLLLFAACILLPITTISAPIIKHAGLLRVTLANYTAHDRSALNFRTFGYCVLHVPPVGTKQSWCTGRHIGYDPSDVVYAATHTTFSNTSGGTANSLTRVMILHPIACCLAFVGFLSALGGRTITTSLSGTLVALLTWVLVLVSLAVDFTAFGIIRHHVNDQAGGVYPEARSGSAMWCLVASLILLSGGIVVMGMSLFGAAREKRAENRRAAEAQAAESRREKRKRFGIF